MNDHIKDHYLKLVGVAIASGGVVFGVLTYFHEQEFRGISQSAELNSKKNELQEKEYKTTIESLKGSLSEEKKKSESLILVKNELNQLLNNEKEHNEGLSAEFKNKEISLKDKIEEIEQQKEQLNKDIRNSDEVIKENLKNLNEANRQLVELATEYNKLKSRSDKYLTQLNKQKELPTRLFRNMSLPSSWVVSELGVKVSILQYRVASPQEVWVEIKLPDSGVFKDRTQRKKSWGFRYKGTNYELRYLGFASGPWKAIFEIQKV